MKLTSPTCLRTTNPWLRCGATAVEFAVVAPLFFFFIFAIFEFGRTIMVMNLLDEAARRGCRKGIVPGTTTQAIKDEATNFLTLCNISGESVSVVINDGAGNITEAADLPSYSELTVSASVKVNQISWISFWMYPNPDSTLTGTWTLRRE